MENNTVEKKEMKKCNKCEVIKNTELFDRKTFVSDKKKNRPNLLRFANICKDCQKERNRLNYIKRNCLCKKCDQKKIQITDLNTGEVRLMCRNCKPISFMDKSQKKMYEEIKKKFKNDKQFKALMKAYGPLLPRLYFV